MYIYTVYNIRSSYTLLLDHRLYGFKRPPNSIEYGLYYK